MLSPTQPEFNLYLAVLQQAVDEYLKNKGATRIRHRRLFHDAKVWLNNDNDDWPFSAGNVCAALGIDLGYLRRGLKGPRAWKHVRLQITRHAWLQHTFWGNQYTKAA